MACIFSQACQSRPNRPRREISAATRAKRRREAKAGSGWSFMPAIPRTKPRWALMLHGLHGHAGRKIFAESVESRGFLNFWEGIGRKGTQRNAEGSRRGPSRRSGAKHRLAASWPRTLRKPRPSPLLRQRFRREGPRRLPSLYGGSVTFSPLCFSAFFCGQSPLPLH